MRTRAAARLTALVAVAALATGCSGHSKGDDDTTSLPSKAELTTYFQAIAGYDVTGLEKAADDIAAAGSPARGYALYQGQVAQAIAAAGQATGSYDVKADGDGFAACGQDGTNCATWSDLRGKGGRLVDFTVNQADLADSLVDLTDQAPVDVEGLFTVQPEYAYRSPVSDQLLVTVQLTAKDLALEPLPAKAVYIEGQDVLSGTKTDVAGPVDAGAKGYVTLTFPDAGQVGLDGQITFPVKVGGASAQSVGFGLATG